MDVCGIKVSRLEVFEAPQVLYRYQELSDANTWKGLHIIVLVTRLHLFVERGVLGRNTNAQEAGYKML